MLNHQCASLHHLTGLMVKPTNPQEDLFSLDPFFSLPVSFSQLFFCHSLSLILSVSCTHMFTHIHTHIDTHTHPKFSQILTPSGKALLQLFNLKKNLSCVSQVFTRYGKCYTFNAGDDGRPPLITTKGGMGNGLELMLDIQQDEYLPVWGETGEGGITHPQTWLSICVNTSESET